MTYLFGWVDDFSRKIMDARYYWDEKLPRMEDVFRRSVLRWGLPVHLYLDNGRVYISTHFLILVTSLGIKKIHHRAYAAWCKGKIENIMKAFKRFQSEAVLAGFHTLEELNSALSAWIEVEYNNKLHSGTGEIPNQQWTNNMKEHSPRRITDIDAFNALFLWRIERTIDKFGTIRFPRNSYPIRGLPVGTNIQLRYNPFDLTQVQVHHQDRFYYVLRASSSPAKPSLRCLKRGRRATFPPRQPTTSDESGKKQMSSTGNKQITFGIRISKKRRNKNEINRYSEKLFRPSQDAFQQAYRCERVVPLLLFPRSLCSLTDRIRE